MKPWFSRTETRQEKLTCLRCHNQLETYPPFTNLHSVRCPFCKTECVLLSLPGFHIQIVLEDAPPIFRSVMGFLQSNLDEISFLHLMLCICQLAEPNRTRWGNGPGEFVAYVDYLRRKDKVTRDNYNLGDPDDPKLIIPYPRPRDFVWPLSNNRSLQSNESGTSANTGQPQSPPPADQPGADGLADPLAATNMMP